eukprot:7435458-Lingulodinium_polyedra.AAC.1
MAPQPGQPKTLPVQPICAANNENCNTSSWVRSALGSLDLSACSSGPKTLEANARDAPAWSAVRAP